MLLQRSEIKSLFRHKAKVFGMLQYNNALQFLIIGY